MTSPSIEVLLTQRFKQDLKKLAKRYRSIRKDLASLIEQLQRGERAGDEISGSQYKIVKVRLKNSDINKGKSAGLLHSIYNQHHSCHRIFKVR